MKKIILILLAVINIVMMVATIVEKFYGTPFVGEHIYSSWWFVTLWTLLTLSGCAYAVKVKLYRRAALALLHGSFLVILIGAATTFFTAQRGNIHLRQGMSSNAFIDDDQKVHDMPFSLEVKTFNVECYPGTDAPLDYISNVVINDEGKSEALQISMNKIGTYKGYRFFQSAYDSDMKGTILGVAHDPVGIAITYLGYLLLLISIIWVLFARHSRLRQVSRIASEAPKMLILGIMLASSIAVQAEEKNGHHVLPEERADKIGKLLVLYNDRVCPVNTLATDFVSKLSGKPTWDGLSANEVYTGWMFYFSNWEDEKIIRIKDKVAQKELGLDGQWASFNDFWNNYNEYKLEAPLKRAYEEGDEKALKHLRDADEKFNLVRMFYNGELLRIFPYSVKRGQLKWFAPGTRELPTKMKAEEWMFVRKALDYMTESIMTGDDETTDLLIDKIGKYQRKRGGNLLPSEGRVDAELFYNNMQAQRWVVFLSLAMGILIFVISFLHDNRLVAYISNGWLGLLFAWLTVLLCLRWYVSGHLPMSNGYETMQFMAWALIILTVCLQKKFSIIRSFGPLLAAFALLVALISGQNPQITQLMPVLQSPLLSIHVAIIMFAYALFAIIFLMSLVSLVKIAISPKVTPQEAPLQKEGRGGGLLLYAEMFLTIGIFIGAVWANVSWGRYWSWDSKETWALITMLIYALPLHATLFPHRKALHIYGRSYPIYDIYMVLAFLSVLFTYFGVNYLLSGMHSYA